MGLFRDDAEERIVSPTVVVIATAVVETLRELLSFDRRKAGAATRLRGREARGSLSGGSRRNPDPLAELPEVRDDCLDPLLSDQQRVYGLRCCLGGGEGKLVF